jgi:uncharacterized protein (TIGR00269 family)
VLFGNVLHWHTEYLARQVPVLAARDGFPRKVKPLVRLGEREMAAYCLIRGIDYQVEECPMAGGQPPPRLQGSAQRHRSPLPGAKHDFYFGYLARASDRFREGIAEEQDALGRCERCGAPTPGEVCAFCRLVDRAGGPSPSSCPRRSADVGPAPSVGGKDEPPPSHPVNGSCSSTARSAATSSPSPPGGEFHTHSGFVPHDQLIGSEEGVTVTSTRGGGTGSSDPRCPTSC